MDSLKKKLFKKRNLFGQYISLYLHPLDMVQYNHLAMVGSSLVGIDHLVHMIDLLQNSVFTNFSCSKNWFKNANVKLLVNPKFSLPCIDSTLFYSFWFDKMLLNVKRWLTSACVIQRRHQMLRFPGCQLASLTLNARIWHACTCSAASIQVIV